MSPIFYRAHFFNILFQFYERRVLLPIEQLTLCHNASSDGLNSRLLRIYMPELTDCSPVNLNRF
ncbi:hypothetical protein OQX61_01130 [Pedobacter sp. PLR]|uniref:hypothetical protein n=1 Tax=Pedobacter sp. PLR TaxID=2994465 RepID=UPI0022485ACE|nr:hypothetical protein [Pedobacter sp. PLR]MCX2449859.1 hypothetical protein [Pedobacter sp. PLR]